MVQRKICQAAQLRRWTQRRKAAALLALSLLKKKKRRRFWVNPILDRRKKKVIFFGRPSPTPNNERVSGVLYANPLSEMCATVQC